MAAPLLGRCDGRDGGSLPGGRSASTGRKRCGPIIMPAPWASSCATASTACAMPRSYSGMYDTFCVALSWPGYLAGCGKVMGRRSARNAEIRPDRDLGRQPGEHAGERDDPCHARAEGTRGAKIACVDIYDTGTMKQADIKMLIRPGTDGALACAIMHVLFRDGHADWPYLEKYTDFPSEFEAHLKTRGPGMGGGDLRLPGGRDRGFRQADRRDQAHLFPPRLWLHALAQRLGQHACGDLDRGGHRRLAI